METIQENVSLQSPQIHNLEDQKEIEDQVYEDSEDIQAFEAYDFGLAADGVHYSFRRLNAHDKNIQIPYFLTEYEFIENLNMKNNRITNLEFIVGLKYLTDLDLSNNLISDATWLSKLIYLRKLNLSSNQLVETSFLAKLRSLEEINFSQNQIQAVVGIENCCLLESVDISRNQLTEMPRIRAITLRKLNLENNKIIEITGLGNFPYLIDLRLGVNRISLLEPLQESSSLVYLSLEKNNITDIRQIDCIRHLRLLFKLTLSGNPINELPDYPLLVIFNLLQLEELDSTSLSNEIKVAAKLYFCPPKQFLAASDHRSQLLHNLDLVDQINPTSISEFHIPYPLFVLVGPPGACKKLLCLRLEEEFRDYLKYTPSHTTRQPYSFEKDGMEYYFVSRSSFRRAVTEGSVVQSVTCAGEYFGLQHQVVNAVAASGMAALAQMDLEGVLGLKQSFWQPKLILIVFAGSESHVQLMRQKAVLSDDEMSEAIIRNRECRQYSDQNEGFFDFVVEIGCELYY